MLLQKPSLRGLDIKIKPGNSCSGWLSPDALVAKETKNCEQRRESSESSRFHALQHA